MIKVIALSVVCSSASAATAVAIVTAHDFTHEVIVTEAEPIDHVKDFVIPAYVPSMSEDLSHIAPAAIVQDEQPPSLASEPDNRVTFEPLRVFATGAPETKTFSRDVVEPTVTTVSFGTRSLGVDVSGTRQSGPEYLIGVYR